MPTATRYYCSLEAVKRAVGIAGASQDAVILAKIEAASEDIEQLLGFAFIPLTETRLFRWPQRRGTGVVLELNDEPLIAVATLQAKAQDSSPTTIASTDYFLEPQRTGPPYRRIEIDLSSSAAFEAGATPQRSISVAGRWGWREDTKAAGTLAAAISNTTATTLDCSNASLIGVGDTLLIDSEALFVSARAALTTSTTLNDTLTASDSDVTVTVADGTKIKQGEVLLLDSEKMLVDSISGNDLTVRRRYDGSVLAAHSTGITVYAYRTLTIVRGVNGTTAATHANAAAIVKYAPPADIVELCQAMAIAHLKQDESAWSGQIAGGEAGVQVRMVDLFYLRQRAIEKYSNVTF